MIGIAAVISLRAYSLNLPINLKRFSFLWLMVFLVELAGHISKAYDIENHWLYNIYDIFFYIFLAYIFKQELQKSTIKKTINIFYLAFTVFVIVNSLFIQGVKTFQTLTIVAGGSFIIFLAAAYFWQLYQSEENENISTDPFFWFSFGLMVYLGGMVPFLGMLNYLWENFEEFTSFYFNYFLTTFSIFLNILVIVGFLCRKPYLKSS